MQHDGAVVHGDPDGPSVGERTEEHHLRQRFLDRALDQARGVKKDAAELMGISQRALSHYLAKYRIDT